jgi:hypothetical protein
MRPRNWPGVSSKPAIIAKMVPTEADAPKGTLAERPKPTPGTSDPHRELSSLQRSTKSGIRGIQPMAGRYNGYHTIRREEIEGYLRFEVFWQNAGWFWRPLFQLDGEAVGPFTTSSQAYQSAVAANDTVVRPRRAS